ncbi:MAG TPA: hypothetical protein VLS93_15160, partial [Anaeromyxobacteraceae bacterium]|nr:hypothetical protein [Anaeromyxobacteraceae bacterium]
MNVDELVDGLSAEAAEAVRPLLRQAYDRGFREALASAGQPEAALAPAPVEQPAPHPPEPPTPVSGAAPVAWAGGVEPKADDAPGDEGDEDAENGEDAPAPRPILANAKVGTLRRRIIRTFDLGRFDIDVVIC